MSDNEIVVVPTLCTDWSLNEDPSSDKRFWWNNTFSLSVWAETLSITLDPSLVDDDMVWRAYMDFQINYCFKVCPICRKPEGNEDMQLCCYCASTVHICCSGEASEEQIAWKEANKGYEQYLRVCFECDGKGHASQRADDEHEPDNVRRAVLRALSIRTEYPPETVTKLEALLAADAHSPEATRMEALIGIVQNFYQSPQSLAMLKKEHIASKNNGIGVVAAADIPAFTIVGVYPGYNDALSGELAKIGRPLPKYALMDLNCANFYNEVFVEFSGTFTPFINEPNVNETSNCAWIQEPHRAEGRLSIITVRAVSKGEELTIGYGPLYPRDYPHTYDAYAFHPVENYTDPVCFALWHWPSLEEKDANFVCYVGYVQDEDRYIYWETEDELKDAMGS